MEEAFEYGMRHITWPNLQPIRIFCGHRCETFPLLHIYMIYLLIDQSYVTSQNGVASDIKLPVIFHINKKLRCNNVAPQLVVLTYGIFTPNTTAMALS